MAGSILMNIKAFLKEFLLPSWPKATVFSIIVMIWLAISLIYVTNIASLYTEGYDATNKEIEYILKMTSRLDNATLSPESIDRLNNMSDKIFNELSSSLSRLSPFITVLILSEPALQPYLGMALFVPFKYSQIFPINYTLKTIFIPFYWYLISCVIVLLLKSLKNMLFPKKFKASDKDRT
jgi:hypothetical protein